MQFLWIGRQGCRPLRRGLLSSITTVNLVQFNCHYGHGTPCPYDCWGNNCCYLSGSHTGLPLQCNISVCIYTVGATLCGRPKRYLYINLKFGLQFSPSKLTFPLELPAEALGKLSFILQNQTDNISSIKMIIWSFNISKKELQNHSSFLDVVMLRSWFHVTDISFFQ